MNNKYELTPKFDSAQSFYNKAHVVTNHSIIKLMSYDTHVATVDLVNNTVKVFDTYSTTTLRHIKEFLKQQGFKADNKNQILKDYCQA